MGAKKVRPAAREPFCLLDIDGYHFRLITSPLVCCCKLHDNQFLVTEATFS